MRLSAPILFAFTAVSVSKVNSSISDVFLENIASTMAWVKPPSDCGLLNSSSASGIYHNIQQ